MVKRKRAQKPQTPLLVDLRTKMLKIVHRHRQLKTSFQNLKSEIKTGLLDAEDVFHSLSIPLMKLVGLKTEEMAEEGRSSTFYSLDSSKPPFPSEERDQKFSLKEEENYSERVRKAGKELMEKQRVQLQRLIYLLRKIEIHVNTRQDDILENLNHHAHSIHSIFQKSASYLTNVHRIDRANNNHRETAALISMVLKLLKGIFEQMNLVTGSVGDGVKDLIRELAEHMCYPMVDYVQEIKAEIATGGTLKKLIDVVGEMERVMLDGRLKLEEARKVARIEQAGKFEALRRLKESEEKRLALNEWFGILSKAKENSKEPLLLQHKVVASEEDQIVDESIRSLLKTASKNGNNKVQSKFPTSPWGTAELLKFVPSASSKKTHEPLISRGNYQNEFSTAVVEPVVINQNLRRTTGSVTRTLRSQMSSPGNPSSDCWPVLGSSPSVLVDQCQQRKQNVQKHISSSKKNRAQTWR
ncbi:hypothetical protein MKW94_010595 [Papaver nudicaule]|uniref:Uncharacterized protein n=1 Tax=Papaver nudicaule TaxID=74823 RepID=A0AA41VWK3_PAPNU|nr:hypothetical protein [Papaver nudicaule]